MIRGRKFPQRAQKESLEILVEEWRVAIYRSACNIVGLGPAENLVTNRVKAYKRQYLNSAATHGFGH